MTNRTAALEALRFKKVALVLTGPAEYAVMGKRVKSDVVVGLYRPDYLSMILVNGLLIVGEHVPSEVTAGLRDAIGANSDALITAILAVADHVKRYGACAS